MKQKLVLENKVKELRFKKNMSQQQLANVIGVSRNTISSIETGVFIPSAKLACLLCVALDVKFEKLFFLKYEK